MESIKIYDNFLNEEELSCVIEFIKKYSFSYGHSSGRLYTNGSFENVYSKFFAKYDLHDIFSNDIKEKIEEKVGKKFTIDRLYIHIQMFGQDGAYHVDTIEIENKYKYSCCLYINDINIDLIENSGGEFIIKIPNEKHNLAISPINNRLVYFPSYYIHKGLAFNKHHKNMRICIAYKFTENII